MAEYISKSSLVSEIEKRISEYENCGIDDTSVNAKIIALQSLLIYINSIEAKEVDLENEIEKYVYSLPHSVTGTASYVSDIKSPIAREFGIRHNWSYEYVEQIAEHFFELGMQVSNKQIK